MKLEISITPKNSETAKRSEKRIVSLQFENEKIAIFILRKDIFQETKTAKLAAKKLGLENEEFKKISVEIYRQVKDLLKSQENFFLGNLQITIGEDAPEPSEKENNRGQKMKEKKCYFVWSGKKYYYVDVYRYTINIFC